jgi:hypothetical protein
MLSKGIILELNEHIIFLLSDSKILNSNVNLSQFFIGSAV